LDTETKRDEDRTKHESVRDLHLENECEHAWIDVDENPVRASGDHGQRPQQREYP
jgi:hypothetical protein